MRARVLIALSSIAVSAALAAPQVATEWTAPFGKRAIAKSDGSQETVTVFLMRSGFFRAPTIPDLDARLKRLLSETPSVHEFDVAESTMLEGSRSVYVWFVADGRNLNVEMVRYGWFAGGTQVGGEGWRLLVSSDEDASFQKQLADAEREARQHHRGIWADEDKETEANKPVEPTSGTRTRDRETRRSFTLAVSAAHG